MRLYEIVHDILFHICCIKKIQNKKEKKDMVFKSFDEVIEKVKGYPERKRMAVAAALQAISSRSESVHSYAFSNWI